MYTNPIDGRPRPPQTESRKVRPSDHQAREFGETFADVLTADAVEVTLFDKNQGDGRSKRFAGSRKGKSGSTDTTPEKLEYTPGDTTALAGKGLDIKA